MQPPTGNYVEKPRISPRANSTSPLAGPRLGVGYRPELALAIERRSDLAFVEILAEDYPRLRDVPAALKTLHKRGVEILVHSTSLSLGQAPGPGLAESWLRPTGTAREEQDRLRLLGKQLKHLNEIASYFDAPFVSDHIAFVRAGGLESGHLLPVERTETMLSVLQKNITLAKERLRVPLVLENIACTFDQPGAEMDEAAFVSRVIEENDCRLLLDLSNLFANAHNLGFSAQDYLARLPLDRLEYVHLAGGMFKRGLYHDTHCHPLKLESLMLLSDLATLTDIPRVMLERDDSFPPEEEFNGELQAIKSVVKVERPEAAPAKVRAAVERGGTLTPPDWRLSDSASARQARLVRALLGLARAPQEFDNERIAEAAQALTRKRLRAMKRAHPCLLSLFSQRGARNTQLRPESSKSSHCDKSSVVEVESEPAREQELDQALLKYFVAYPAAHPDGPFADSQRFLKGLRAWS